MSAIKAVCEIVGSGSRLAEMLDVTPQAVSKWVAADRTPPERCIDIELICQRIRPGAVTRYDLRPDVFGDKPDAVAAAVAPTGSQAAA